MEPQNLLIIMADEHNPKVLGCAGHPVVMTPHLDRLAANGVRFTSAYTASPICVPARTAFATGRHVWEMGYWDNADPYDGRVPSWHHYLRTLGHEVVSIGKLHFRGRPGDDHGFSQEIIPMHVDGGTGNLKTSVRDMSSRRDGAKLLKLAGPGESTYSHYDRDIASQTQIWLYEAARRRTEKPWVLFVSFVAPHFPLTAPPEYYYQYAAQSLPAPKLYAKTQRPTHPCIKYLAEYMDYDTHFRGGADVQRALAGYYGLTSLTDEHVGKVLRALEKAGLASNTRVVYTSDHGDNLGARGLWGKSTMYEEAARVPLIVRGTGLSEDEVCTAPVSLLDLFPFVLECVGAPLPEFKEELAGISLNATLKHPEADRVVISEYHAVGSKSAVFMLRQGKYKYIHYVGDLPQLFNLDRDPEEIDDLAAKPGSASLIAELEKTLRSVLDPDAVDRRAKKRQSELIEQAGGRDAVLSGRDFGWTPAPGTTRE